MHNMNNVFIQDMACNLQNCSILIWHLQVDVEKVTHVSHLAQRCMKLL